MSRRRVIYSIPLAHGCRLILAEPQLGDLDAALALLGLSRSGIKKPAPSGEDLLISALDSEMSGQDVELGFDDTPPTDPGEPNDGGGSELVQNSGDYGSDVISRQFFSRAYRSMIAYMLSPDQPSADRVAEQPIYDYDTIPSKVQRVQRPTIVPDSEAWRAARRASDAGNVLKNRGKVDLRHCVMRLARGEVLDYLPRVKTLGPVGDLTILIATELSMGVFSSDVDQLTRALRSITSGANQDVLGVAHRDGEWFAGSGPIWMFAPLVVPHRRTWFVIIAGGCAATPSNLERWDRLIASLGERHLVTMLWLGDSMNSKRARGKTSWISFRL
jgi:hypothetical protein